MSILDFAVLGLATWRLASLFAREDGPYDIFPKLRYFVGVRYDEKSKATGKNVIAQGITCIWCNSVWFGSAWMIAYLIAPWTVWLAFPFALSAIAILFDCVVGDSYGNR